MRPSWISFFEGNLGDLAADAVKARHHNHARRVVHDHIHTGGLLEGPNVAALAADDASLHLVAGNVDRAHGDLGGVGRGIALDCRREDLAGSLLAGLAHGRVVPHNDRADLSPELVVDPPQQHRPRLLGAKPADLVQQLALFGLDLFQVEMPLLNFFLLLGEIMLYRLELAVLAIDHLELLVQQIAAFFEFPLLLAQAPACFFELAVELLAAPQRVFLGQELGLHANGIRLAMGAGE